MTKYCDEIILVIENDISLPFIISGYNKLYAVNEIISVKIKILAALHKTYVSPVDNRSR